MRRAYSERINNVIESYSASLASLQFVERHYNDADVATVFAAFELSQIRAAASQVEDAFYVRLFAEYQGILKDHIRTNYPDVVVDDQNSDLDGLLSQIRDKEQFPINLKLRENFNLARTYRNHIAHNSPPFPGYISIWSAAEYLSKIVSKFADPLKR